MKFWGRKEDIKSDFSEGLFALPKRRKIESDCEIVDVVTPQKPISQQVLTEREPSYPFLGNFDFSRLQTSIRRTTRIRDNFVESGVFDFDAKAKYAKLLEKNVSLSSSVASSSSFNRRRPHSSVARPDESGFSKLFDTSAFASRKTPETTLSNQSNMGNVVSRFGFLRRNQSNDAFADNLEQIDEIVSAVRVPGVERRLVDYDDSILSDALEISERFSSSYIDEKFRPTTETPKRVIEVEPIPIDEDALKRGLDNSKLYEQELERIEKDRIRQKERAELAEKYERLSKQNIENQCARLEAAIAAEKRSRLQIDLEKLSIVLDLPSEQDSFPPLSPEANNLVARAWNRQLPDAEVFVDANPFKIARKDLRTLSGLDWLNDEIINFYCNLIVQRSAANGSDLPKVYAFQTFFYQTLGTRGYTGVKRWTRKVDVFAYDIWLIPVHLSVHWCLAVVDVPNSTIHYYDSMLGKNSDVFELILDYIASEHKDKKKTDISTTNWRAIRRTDIPTQENGSDCGMFTCKFAEYASRRAEIDFTQKHMPYFRKRMVWEICQQELMQS